jgi:DNA-binding transcriptional ArsR family regulator
MAAAGGAPFGVTALALAVIALRKPQWRDALRALHAGALEPLDDLLRALSEDVRVLVQHVLAARADLDTLIAQFDRGAARLVDAMITLPRHDSATLARAATLSRARSEILLTRLEQAGLVRREHGGSGTTVWHFVHLHALWNRLHEALLERRHRAPANA